MCSVNSSITGLDLGCPCAQCMGIDLSKGIRAGDLTSHGEDKSGVIYLRSEVLERSIICG